MRGMDEGYGDGGPRKVGVWGIVDWDLDRMVDRELEFGEVCKSIWDCVGNAGQE